MKLRATVVVQSSTNNLPFDDVTRTFCRAWRYSNSMTTVREDDDADDDDDDVVDTITEKEDDEGDEDEVEEEDEEKSATAFVDDSLVLNACQPAQDGWGHCIDASKTKDTQNTDISALPSSHTVKHDRNFALFFLCLSFSLLVVSPFSSLFPSLCPPCFLSLRRSALGNFDYSTTASPLCRSFCFLLLLLFLSFLCSIRLHYFFFRLFYIYVRIVRFYLIVAQSRVVSVPHSTEFRSLNSSGWFKDPRGRRASVSTDRTMRIVLSFGFLFLPPRPRRDGLFSLDDHKPTHDARVEEFRKGMCDRGCFLRGEELFTFFFFFCFVREKRNTQDICVWFVCETQRRGRIEETREARLFVFFFLFFCFHSSQRRGYHSRGQREGSQGEHTRFFRFLFFFALFCFVFCLSVMFRFFIIFVILLFFLYISTISVFSPVSATVAQEITFAPSLPTFAI